MTYQNINDLLLAKAEESIARNDLQGAGIMLKQIIEQDYTNPDAWRLLQQLLAPKEPIDQFRLSFSRKYYPGKSYLLAGDTDQRAKNVNLQDRASDIGKKKCPYCSEEIQEEAIICKHCSRDLNKETPEEIRQKRTQLTWTLAELENKLSSWKRYHQIQNELYKKCGSNVMKASVGILAGLFLIPVFGIGLIFIVGGILTVFIICGQSIYAANKKALALQKIELISGKIVEVKTALAGL